MLSQSFKRILLSLSLFLGIAAACIVFFKEPQYRYRLSLLAIFQNEDRFLKEWIDFHLLMGVEHFYLFNNLSSDNYLTVLHPYINEGIVELHDWPYASQAGSQADWTNIQSSAYRSGIELAKGESKWLAIIDTDEFLFPVQKNSISEFLCDFENCSGILINWQMFGTSHVKRIPEDCLMIEMLTLQSHPQFSENKLCKSIVRPDQVKWCVDPHTVVYFPWSYSVDPDKYIFPWKFHASHPIKIDKIRINHYWSRDEDFFHERKIVRSEQWGDAIRNTDSCLKRNENANQVENFEIFRFIPKVKRNLCVKLDILL